MQTATPAETCEVWAAHYEGVQAEDPDESAFDDAFKEEIDAKVARLEAEDDAAWRAKRPSQ